MTPTLDERAKAIVDYAWCKRTTEDPPLIAIALEHLRAVERAAYERAAEVAKTDFKDQRPKTDWERGYDCGRQYASEDIRALADGGSDG